jgi:hypothetical protein
MAEKETNDAPERSRSAIERKPPCKLSGKDGNVFSVIGHVRRALLAAGLKAEAREFVQRAFGARSYDAVLGLCFDYVEVR